MESIVAGVIGLFSIGAVFGALAKWGIDLINERMRHRREDRVWRRGRYTDAAADLLVVCRELANAEADLDFAIRALGKVEDGDPDRVPEAQRRHEAALAAHRLLLERASQAFEVLRLFAPQPVFEQGRELRKLAAKPREVGKMREHLDAVNECAERFVSTVRDAAGSDQR